MIFYGNLKTSKFKQDAITNAWIRQIKIYDFHTLNVYL